MNLLSKTYAKVLSLSLYKIRFKHFGKKSRIDSPLRIDGMQNIEIGNNTLVQYKTWLACLPLTSCKNPILKIGDNVRLGNFNHIYATQSIIIEDYVLTADKVYIADNLHSYEDISIPIIAQKIKQTKNVVIGEGAWLGENVCIIGASVGKHSVVGANSVVTKDIPDYCIAVGVPAKVIKKYNFETKNWDKI